MQSVNVLQPTAPDLYPQLQPDFRMQKINEISTNLNAEVSHYRAVGKKTSGLRIVAPLVLVGFHLYFQARVSAQHCLLSACLLQSRLVESAALSRCFLQV